MSRMKKLLGLLCLMSAGAFGSSVYDFTMKTIDGKPLPLASLKGKVVMLVNVASRCGYTPQYTALESVYEKYRGKGLVIAGLTTYYKKLGFDKDKGKLSRLEEEQTTEQEQTMLKDFAAHHKLDHLLQTMPQDDIKAVYENYKVRGIPHVVLIDRKGILRELNPTDLKQSLTKLLEEAK